MVERKKPNKDIINSEEFNKLVESSLEELQAMENSLLEAGYDEEQARLKVQQLHINNLKKMSDPAAASVNILAELKTRIDLDRLKNPESDLLSSRYVELLDQMRKTIKLVNDTQGKTITHQVSRKDDEAIKNIPFIDVESDENEK